MNTPSTKPILRFGRPPKKWHKSPDGHYVSGLWIDEFVLEIGRIITFFPIIEQGMSDVLAELIGGHDPPARQVFFSITNQQARIKVMRSLLQEAQINRERNESWDKILDDFSSISRSRSNYAHGLWWTHDSNRVFLSEPDPSLVSYHNHREVKMGEIKNVIIGMNDLAGRLREIGVERIKRLNERNENEAARRQTS